MAMEGADLWVTSASAFSINGYAQAPGAAVLVTTNGAGSYSFAGTQSGGCFGTLYPTVAASQPPVISPGGDPGNDLNKMLTICGGPTYRGQLQLVRTGDGVKHTVNLVGVEDYLRGVVPRESPSSFAAAALEAQAVAARSYAMAEGGETGQRYPGLAKTCDTTSCQVYGGAGLNGASREAASTNASVVNTANLVRRYTSNNTLARTEFSSSTGGYTAGGDFPAVPDDGDAVSSNPRHNWQTSISASALSSRYGIGQFVGIQITQRNGVGDWGGRVVTMSVIGTSKSVSLSGDQFRTDWALFSNWFTSDANNGPGAVSPTAGRTDVFARGADGAVWQRTEAGGLGAWQSIGGLTTSDPDASSWGANRIDVFVRGTDNALWQRTYNGAWQGWDGLGGSLFSSPTAVSWGPNRIDVFAKGSDGALWSRAWTGSSWTNWYSLGGGFIGDPDVASWGPNRLDVFVRGLDNGLWHLAWNGSTWSSWESLGGGLTSGPGAVSWGANRIDVVGRGSDGAVWSRAFTGSSWVPWYSLAGGFSSDLDIASPGIGKLVIVGRGLDAAIWQRSWDGSTWSNWFTLGPPG
jgi:SpoIID/LytB domain protein